MHYKTTKRSSNLLLHFIIWACIALTCQYTPAFAQQNKQYNFRHIDQRDGLLHNSVFAIAQDQTGFMWIGSRNGLQRYDGLRFISYQKELAPLSFAALITNLHPDGKGNIWVTTTQLAKLHAASKQLTIYDSTVLQNPAFKFDTYIDEHNEAWLLGSCGLFYRDSVSKKMKQYAPALPVYTSNFGTAVFYDKVTKNAWTAGPYGLRLFDYKTKKVYTHNYNPGNNPVLQLFDNKNISCMLIDKNGDFWLSTWEGELINYNAVTKKKRHYALASIPREGKKKRGTVSVNCLYRDSKGNLWIGTDNMGLLQYNSRDDNITQIQAKDDQQQGVQFNYSFFCITEDKDGNLWLGTDKGISIFNPYYPYFQTITHQENNKASLPKSEINAILNGSNGDIYIGTWGGGFTIYDSALSFKKTIMPHGVFELPLTWSFAESDDKMIWVGAQHGYIHVYNPATGNFKTIHPPEMENITIRCIKKDGEGNLWFGLHNGKIVKWDRRSASFFSSVTNSSVINPNPVLNLFIDRRNHFWVCTDNGILEFDQSKLQYIGNYSPATNSTLVKNNTTLMRGVEQMNDSTLAVGSMRSGVFFFNTRTKEFNRNPILSSLNSANVYALKNDPDHNLWITSDYQLHQLRSTDNTLRSYKIQSGILNSSFENLNFYTLQNGLLATSTFTEAIIFDPSILNAASQLNEAVLVTGFKIFDKEIFIDSTVAAGQPVKLNYDQNFISLQFTTLSYSGIEETVFYYKLSEVDKDWVKTDADGVASYTNLPPGEYIFSVKAKDVNEMTPATSFRIIIAPPFWKTWWFLTLIACTTILLIYQFIRQREKSIKAVEAEKLKVQELKAEQYSNKLEMEKIVNFFSSSLINKNTVDDVLWDVAKNLIGRMGFEDCMIYLWNSNKTKMIQRAGYGPKGSIEEIKNRYFDAVPGQGIVGYVMQTKEAVLIPDTSKEPRYRVDDLNRLSEITVPIIYNDELIGVIDSEHHRRGFYTQQHVQVLSTIATLTADKIKSIEAEQLLQQTKIEMLRINEKLSEAKLDALRSQMNPHFIFNCINAIDNLIQTNQPDKATTYLARFAKLIRSVLESSKNNVVPFHKDFETLKLFLELEQFRCSNKFSFELEADDELFYGDYKVPPLIVQPFAENAIHHGLLNKQEGVRKLSIKVALKNNYISYVISDTGVGRAKALQIKELNKPEHISYGIDITEERVQLHNQNGKRADIVFYDIIQNGLAAGTTVEVNIKTDH